MVQFAGFIANGDELQEASGISIVISGAVEEYN